MSKHVVSFILHAKAADDDFDAAYRVAAKRLEEAADKVKAGRALDDPGIDFRILDPGGGGGPCAPNIRTQDFDVSDSGLPEARSQDD